MSNRKIANILETTAHLLELLEENSFKIKALLFAAYKIDRIGSDLSTYTLAELDKIEGIGKGIAQKIHEIIQTGTTQELTQLKSEIPPGVIQMLGIKGIGSKKLRVLWKELHIESPGELLYACYENRLVTLKGFGEKTQESIQKAIEFALAHEGKSLYSDIEVLAEKQIHLLQKQYPHHLFAYSGDFHRKCEIIESLDLLTTFKPIEYIRNFEQFPIKVNIMVTEPEEFWRVLFNTSASTAFLEAFYASYSFPTNALSEEDVFLKNKLPFIIPAARESAQALEMAQNGSIHDVVQFSDIKGMLHIHTQYSDGKNTLEEMAQAVKNLGMDYIGITDHSQSAFYAGGLKVEAIEKQHQEIEEWNKNSNNFKILKGIESDILIDGRLDYEDDILQRFDFVIASVHSVLKMDIEKATQRLIKAIESPFTTILGHLSGRLLLSRPAYPLDMNKIIDACAANHVIIELNANPYRLDIDWRYIQTCVQKGVYISINPDAHSIKGLDDIHYGLLAAQKGLLKKQYCFNTQSLESISQWLKKK